MELENSELLWLENDAASRLRTGNAYILFSALWIAVLFKRSCQTDSYTANLLLSHSVKETAMLVITRRQGESVEITHGITVTILELESGRIKLGFIAPKDIEIMRSELLDETREGSIEGSSKT